MITTIAVKVRDVSRIAAVSQEMELIPDIQVVTMTQIMGTIMNLAGSARSLLLTVIVLALIISALASSTLFSCPSMKEPESLV